MTVILAVIIKCVFILPKRAHITPLLIPLPIYCTCYSSYLV
uniref:Uncharacterized protein n=1 Tax=Anguilla anguilla TaxID=7936 RepID=A0A0E9PUL0_ANGAN